MPNVLGPLSVAATFYMAQAILLEAALSFLGLGVKPPAPSWGNMVNLATNANTLQNMPWVWVPPALAIALLVLAITSSATGCGTRSTRERCAASDPGRRDSGPVAGTEAGQTPLLAVEDLRVEFAGARPVRAVRGLSYAIGAG